MDNWPYIKTRVRVQRVDSSGNLLWGQTGVRVSLSETNQIGQRLVSDGDGGAIIVWQSYDSIGIFESISMNRINRFGDRVWGDSGIVLPATGTGLMIISASDGNYYVQVYPDIFRINQDGEIINQYNTTLVQSVADPEGGVVLSSVVGNINNRRLVAQRKDSLGNNLWQEPYVEIADSLYYLNPSLSIKQNNNFYYYSWTGKKNGIDKVTQFQALRLDGNKLFPDGSIKVGNPPLNGTIVLPLAENRTAFIYYNKDFLPDSLLVQNYDSLGNKLWNEDGILIAHPPIEYQSYTTDGNGGFIIGGVINNFTVVVQQVSKYGHLGEIVTSIEPEKNNLIPSEITLHQNYPNPFNSQTTIKYTIPSECYVKMELYSVIGKLIKTIVDTYHQKGTYTVTISSNTLPSGIYFYKLTTDTKSLIKKLIIIK